MNGGGGCIHTEGREVLRSNMPNTSKTHKLGQDGFKLLAIVSNRIDGGPKTAFARTTEYNTAVDSGQKRMRVASCSLCRSVR